MDRAIAATLLKSKSSEDRIRGARYLTRNGLADDVPALEESLRDETNKWAKSAIKRAISALHNEATPKFVTTGVEDEEERGAEQIAADAIYDTTQKLVHELRPVLGRLDVYASKEIASYSSSQTKAEWTRLRDLLNGIDKLGQAASTPSFAEIEFVGLLERIIQSEGQGSSLKMEMSGTKPFVIVADAELLQIVLSNAIRNSIEATNEISGKEPIIVTWGDTDKDYWVAVLDRGKGFPQGFAKVFEIGTTSKKDHRGMGLALARQAAISLSGEINLFPREPNGAKFEFRWPKISP